MSGESYPDFWAKTIDGDRPGLSVRDHCLNVGCVAEALLAASGKAVKALIPPGAVTLAALHDVGKISTGFQAKCQTWLEQSGFADVAMREHWRNHSESDHAKVSQYFLQQVMKSSGGNLWAVAAGVHHGRIFGKRIPGINFIRERVEWETAAREHLLGELIAVFGPLPAEAPLDDQSNLWCVAGLISVADWIGSNEDFFPCERGLLLEESRKAASAALDQIYWRGGGVRSRSFAELFEGKTPKALQETLHAHCESPGLFIVEGPMGCGKTEAALWAAHRLIQAGVNDGMYFALPTQVTSNRIHQRVAPFLESALADAATFRLAHAASWLDGKQTMRLHPADPNDPEAAAHVREGRSWFASSKHAMLARFGVGTVDQALQGVVAVKHFFVRRFGLAGKVVILDEIHSYDVYTGALITRLIRELLALRCSVIVLSATLTRARRAEIIAAAGVSAESAQSPDYPLVTVARAGAPFVEIAVQPPPPRELKLRTAALSEDEIFFECIERAESGQHVLYLRNTVAEAQETCRKLAGSVRADRVKVAALHSRFPFFRRQELENEWLTRLGKDRASDGMGSLLIATQVVEQSVDIDLDFIVSDLAPTDMLLQRMGRLWRHERKGRLATEPEFWINAPLMDALVDTSESDPCAPTGQPKPAQGNALGKTGANKMSPEGAAQNEAPDCRAPSGLTEDDSPTQGVALGWLASGRWPEMPVRGMRAASGMSARELKKAFGKSGFVYAPYVLLRTAEVFAGRETIVLPQQIREVLEATYAERGDGEEPEAWTELRAEVDAEREELAQEADAATRVLGRQSEDDTREHLTRRKGPPTRDVVLVRACERISSDKWRLTMLDDESLNVSGFEWSIAAARALHCNLVRVPRHTVPPQKMPPWLSLHTHGLTAWALVRDDGSLNFPGGEGESALAYDSMLGLHTRAGQPQPRYTEDEDEFDS